MENENGQLNRKKFFLYLTVSIGIITILIGMGLGSIMASSHSGKSNTPSSTITPEQGSLSSTMTPEYTSTPSVQQTSTATPHATPTVGRTPTVSTTPTVRVTPTTAITPTVRTQPPVSSASPLLFGTNLTLKDANDQVLTSSTTRSLLQQIRISMIRIPMRDNLSDATLIQAAQMVKNLGAVPLVILQGDKVDPNALADDTRIINAMNTIFGNSTVWYEYGNEEDFFAKLPADDYTASWNRVIPQLKKIAPNGRFVGPVNYQYNSQYLQYFLKNANPRPDAVSWHEYTCGSEWTNDLCLQRIDNWTVHVNNARNVMSSTIGANLPIMITEWNYTPNPAPNDGKMNNSEFMTTWTTKALQTLAANGIYAAMQYSCTDYMIPLIDQNNTLTTQGTVFKQQRQLMVGS